MPRTDRDTRDEHARYDALLDEIDKLRAELAWLNGLRNPAGVVFIKPRRTP